MAKKYVITDSDWQILNFASDMKSLTGRNLTFQTAPVITTDGHMGGQTVNLIDPAQVKRVVQDTFYPPSTATQPTAAATSPASSAAIVDVFNGGAPPGLAGEMSRALTSAGFGPGKVGNIATQSSTQVLYGAGAEASAAKIAGYFNGVTATASPSVAAGHVELLLGRDATSVPPGIGSAASPSSPAASASPSPTSSAGNGQAGGAVKVQANAKFGIPCVY